MYIIYIYVFFKGTATTSIYTYGHTLSRHDALPSLFGQGHRASADCQAFYLGGPGEAGGAVNAHYGRDPVVKIYTTITDRYAPLHKTVIAGTAGEAIHEIGRAS